MKVIKKDKDDNMFVCTLTELVSIDNPNFLFTFIHEQQKKPINVILNDTSNAPQRYNLFIIDEPNDIEFEFVGDYLYEVREQSSTTNLDPANSGAIIERGRCVVIGDGKQRKYYDSEKEENYIFKE